MPANHLATTRLKDCALATLICAFASGAALCENAAHSDEVETLRACLLANNLPYASRAEGIGFDLDTATAVAGVLARPLELVWTNNAAMQEIEDSDFPLHKLARGECDAIFSMPGPAEDTLAGDPGLVLGEAYYGAAFEIIGCGNELPTRLRGLRNRTVAIQSQTIAHFALLMVQAKPQTYFAPDKAIAGLANGEADAGLLWGPAAGWQIHRTGSRCAISPDYQPPAAVSWNLHAATRKADAEFRLRLDAALLDLSTTERLGEIGRRYGMPVRPPFEKTYSLRALNQLQLPGD